MQTMTDIAYLTCECLDDYDFNRYIFRDIEELADFITGSKDDYLECVNRLNEALSNVDEDDPVVQLPLPCRITTSYRGADDWDEKDTELMFEVEAFWENE